MLFAKKKDLIGIDIGSTSIKLVKLVAGKGGYAVDSLGIVPLPREAIIDNNFMDSSSVVDGLKTLIHGLQITDVKDVASSISGNSVIIRKISLPTVSAEELENEIQWEAEQYIPFDISDVNIDFQMLGPDESDPSKMFVLLVASKKDIVNDYLSVFVEAGLKLVVMDVDAFAIQNAFELNYDADPEEVYALVNIGASMMNLNVVKSGVSLFTRDVQMGGEIYTEEIQKRLGVGSDEAERLKVSVDDQAPANLMDAITKGNETISIEIRRSLDFYNSNAVEGRISKVLLAGGASKTYKLVDTVANRLSLPVEFMNPFARIKCDGKKFEQKFLEEIAPAMTVVVGLASRRLGDK